MKNISVLLFVTMLIATQAAKTGESCLIEDDCPALNECIKNVCVHKELFPITAREVIATLVTVTLNALLTAGGVGAGAAYVPYIMLLFSQTLSHAIYIGYLCVFGGGVGNLVNVIRLKNIKTNRFMTNYDLNMIILPSLMTGVMIGIILQRIFPPLITHLILLLTLVYALVKNYGKLKINLAKERKEEEEKKKATKAKAEEMVHINALTTDSDHNEKTKKYLIPENDHKSPKHEEKHDDISSLTHLPVKASDINLMQNNLNTDTKSKQTPEKDALAEKRKRIMEREQKFPFHKIREILANVIIIILIGLIRGSKSFKPIVGVEWTCGWDYIWFGIAVTAYGLVLARSLYLVLKWQKEKKEVGYEFLPEEPILDRPKIIKLIIVATSAGIIGAIVALGGSMIVGPTLLDFKMPPAFSAATTSFFMIFAMFNTTFNAILSKKVSSQELAWFIPLAFLFSFTSSTIVNWYVRKTGKQSTIIKCIMIVAALGFVCLLAIMIKDLVQDTEAQITFKSACG